MASLSRFSNWSITGNYLLEAFGVKNFRAHEVAPVGKKVVGRDGSQTTLNYPPPKKMYNAAILARDVLEWVRSYDRVSPVIINSWYRDPRYNMLVGGAGSSLHLEGAAADINKQGSTPKEIALILHNDHPLSDKLGIGLYNTFVHVDIRGVIGRQAPSRWGGPGIGNWWI